MQVKLFILGFIRFLLNNLIKPAIRLVFKLYWHKLDYLKPLPKCKNPLLFLPVTQLAQKIRKREVTYLYKKT